MQVRCLSHLDPSHLLTLGIPLRAGGAFVRLVEVHVEALVLPATNASRYVQLENLSN